MQAQMANFMKLVAETNEKNAKPRVIREYRTVKEYYPWKTVAIPAVFPLIGFFLFIKSAADFSKAFKFGGVFYLILALIFVGIGILFAYPSKSDFSSCKRLRETFKTAENRGKRYQAIRQAKNQYEQVKLQADNTERQLMIAVRQNLNTMEMNMKSYYAAQNAVASAQKAYEIAEAAYRVGRSTLIELNDAQLALTQSRLAESQAIYNFVVAKAQLEQTIGKELSK